MSVVRCKIQMSDKTTSLWWYVRYKCLTRQVCPEIWDTNVWQDNMSVVRSEIQMSDKTTCLWWDVRFKCLTRQHVTSLGYISMIIKLYFTGWTNFNNNLIREGLKIKEISQIYFALKTCFDNYRRVLPVSPPLCSSGWPSWTRRLTSAPSSSSRTSGPSFDWLFVCLPSAMIQTCWE